MIFPPFPSVEVGGCRRSSRASPPSRAVDCYRRSSRPSPPPRDVGGCRRSARPSPPSRGLGGCWRSSRPSPPRDRQSWGRLEVAGDSPALPLRRGGGRSPAGRSSNTWPSYGAQAVGGGPAASRLISLGGERGDRSVRWMSRRASLHQRPGGGGTLVVSGAPATALSRGRRGGVWSACRGSPVATGWVPLLAAPP